MDTRSTYFRFILFIVTSAALLVGATWVNFHFADQLPVNSDFLIQWNAAREWVVEGILPYDARVAESTQSLVAGNGSNLLDGKTRYAFVHPLYSMLFFAPFGPLDFASARAIWMTILELSLVGIGWFGLKITGLKMGSLGSLVIVILTLFSSFSMGGILDGDFAILNGFIILLAIYLLQKKQDMDAGLLLAISTSLPSMSFLVVLFSVVWGYLSGRRRFSIGILGGICFLVILSLVFLPEWPGLWIGRAIEILRTSSQNGSGVSMISSTFPGIRNPLTAILYTFSFLYLFIEWFLSWKKTDRYFTWTALLTLAITYFISPGVSAAYFVSLFPAFLLLFRSWRERWGDPGEKIAWGLFIILFISFWGFSKLNLDPAGESKLVILLAFFLTMLMLFWSRWWTLHRPRVFFEEYPS